MVGSRVLAAGAVLGVLGVGAAWAGAPSEPPASFVFVARGDVSIDALAAAPVAGRLDAPVLLTPPTQLAEAARRTLLDLDPDVVIVAGGTAAIGADVFDEIAALVPEADVRRVAGQDRYVTAEALASLIREYDPAFAYGPVDLSDLAPAPQATTTTVACPATVFARGSWVLGSKVTPDGDVLWAFADSPSATGTCAPMLAPGTRVLSFEAAVRDNDNGASVSCTLRVLRADPETMMVDGGTRVTAQVEAETGSNQAPGTVTIAAAFPDPVTVGADDAVELECQGPGGGVTLYGAGVTVVVDAVPGTFE